MDIDELLTHVVEIGASDLHLKLDRPPMLRVDGGIQPMSDLDPLTAEQLEAVLEHTAATVPHRLATFRETGELDTSYQTSSGARFRLNAFRQRGSTSFAFRYISSRIPSFDDLHMPAGIRQLAEMQHGLVLVTGATGAGKSTTLAAVVDHINQTRSQHIVTVEDPIEMLYTDGNCIVNQREIGIDTESFNEALRRALRQDPDTILIGELRDHEAATTALQAAESGHLVLSTMHTVDAAETVSRLVDFFPETKHKMVRSVLAGVLRGVVSQRLLPRRDKGRIAAVEVMVSNERIADLIRTGEVEEIPTAIEEGGFYGMQTLSHALIDLVLADLVDRELAAGVAPNRHDFMIALSHAEKMRATFDNDGADGAAAPPEQAVPADPIAEEGPLDEPEPAHAATPLRVL
jgi:twitching motility protein PilT